MIDCDLLRELERTRAEELCRTLFPNGKKVGNELKVGDFAGDRAPSKSAGRRLMNRVSRRTFRTETREGRE